MKSKLDTNIFLIGFMGAGKSTVSRKLARICGCESVDVDFFIERTIDMKIKDFFSLYGEKKFREVERDALSEIASSDHKRLISCGGGIVVEPVNIETMRKNGFVIHLYSDAKSGAARIKNINSRPLFKDIESATKRFEERLPLYERAADVTVDTTGKNSSEVATLVIRALKESGHLNILEE